MSKLFSFWPRSPLSATLGFVILDIFFGYLHYLNGWTYHMFNLDVEHNLPTLYQGAKYFVLAWICWFLTYYYAQTRRVPKRTFWGLLALTLTWLGLDELGMLHEFLLDVYLVELFPAWEAWQRTQILTRGYSPESSRWIISYAVLALCTLPLSLHWLNLGRRLYARRLWPLGIALVLLVGVVGLEYYGTSGVFGRYYNRIISFEEGFEMVAISIAGLFVFGEFWPTHRRVRALLRLDCE